MALNRILCIWMHEQTKQLNKTIMKEDILSGFSAVYGEISKGGNEDEKGFVDFDTEEDIVEDDEVVVEDEPEDVEEVDEEVDEESSEETDDENADDEPIDGPGDALNALFEAVS